MQLAIWASCISQHALAPSHFNGQLQILFYELCTMISQFLDCNLNSSKKTSLSCTWGKLRMKFTIHQQNPPVQGYWTVPSFCNMLFVLQNEFMDSLRIHQNLVPLFSLCLFRVLKKITKQNSYQGALTVTIFKVLIFAGTYMQH